jgi:hypothetical protein
LYGKKGTPIGDVKYFEEMPDMPKPDNIENGRVVSVLRYGKDSDGRSVMTVVFPQ